MTRLRRLIATALVDSFGLSLGWTVFSLHVVRGHGLAGLGLCNAAMLCGWPCRPRRRPGSAPTWTAGPCCG